jgi:HK97 family phage portal protein
VSRWTAPVSALARGRRRDVDNRSPVPLAPRIRQLFGYDPAGGMFEYLSAYLNDPVIRPIVARLFQGVSSTRWHLYSKSTTGDPQDRVEITSHALLDLLDRPNNFQTFGEIMARGQQHWELVGEASIVLGFQPGVKYPLDMWVLRPDRINPVPDPYAFLAGWIYTAPGDGEKIPLETRELLRMVDPSPIDPYRGAGAVQALVRDLDAQRFTKEWQANFFQNNAQPGGLIKADHRLDDAEFEEMRSRWAEQHQGVNKAHRVAILENTDWIPNSFSLRDLQLAEMESLGRDKTLTAFGMSKSMIGVVEDVNRANAEAGEYMFAADMIKPRLEKWRQMLNLQLLPLFDPTGRLELDFDDPVPENSEANIAERKTNFDVLIAAVAAGFDNTEVAEYLSLPDFGYVKPEVPAFGQHGDPLEGISSPIQTPDNPTSNRGLPAVDMAMRWVATGHKDSHCCAPCEKNIGTLYRSRTAAYADYPLNKGYIKCIGAQYGNHCRCKVVKRRSQRDE